MPLFCLVAFIAGMGIGIVGAIYHFGARIKAIEERLGRLMVEIGRLRGTTEAKFSQPPQKSPPATPTPSTATAFEANRQADKPELILEEIPIEAAEEVPALPFAQTAAPPLTPTPEPVRAKPDAKPKPSTLEERVGVRAFVWIAAVALALSGAMLVKYSFEHKLISAPVRISMGFLFGITMLAAGEWMLRKSARIAQALTAAGVSTLFAALLAGVHLEGLIPKPIGFVLMAAVAALAVVLSLRQGPLVALLGLAGGFAATPALLGSDQHQPGSLFGYLFVLQLALVAVTRWQKWRWLTLLTLLAGYGWAIAWLVFLFHEGDETALAMFVLGTSALFMFGAVSLRPVTTKSPSGGAVSWDDVIRWGGAGLGLLLMGGLIHAGRFDVSEWVFLGILGAACLVLGRLAARSQGLAWFAAAASMAMLVVWSLEGVKGDQQSTFGWIALGLGLLYALGGYAAMWNSRQPWAWAMLSILSAIGFLLTAYWSIQPPAVPHFWGGLCLLLCFAYSIGAWPVSHRRASDPDSNQALAVLATGAAAFVALAVPIELEREWIAVSWALLVPAVIAIHRRLNIPELRVVAAALVAAVVGRLLLNPFVLDYPAGESPILNWFLYGYGAPVLAFVAAAWMQRQHKRDDWLASMMDVVAVALGLAMATLEIRHFFHRRAMGIDAGLGLVESATYPIAAALVGMGLLMVWRRWPRPHLKWSGEVIVLLSGFIALSLLCLAENPLWNPHAVGSTRVFNWLLYAYGLPSLAAWGASLMLQRAERTISAKAMIVAAFLLLFTLLNLEVRQAYHGPRLDTGALASAENYTYSAVWIGFGAVLLVLGIVLRNVALRWASLAVMLLSIAKVFLWDMSKLTDLLRVFSFLGLGLTLLLVAYLYQRFVFRRLTPRPESDEAAEAVP